MDFPTKLHLPSVDISSPPISIVTESVVILTMDGAVVVSHSILDITGE